MSFKDIASSCVCNPKTVSAFRRPCYFHGIFKRAAINSRRGVRCQICGVRTTRRRRSSDGSAATDALRPNEALLPRIPRWFQPCKMTYGPYAPTVINVFEDLWQIMWKFGPKLRISYFINFLKLSHIISWIRTTWLSQLCYLFILISSLCLTRCSSTYN